MRHFCAVCGTTRDLPATALSPTCCGRQLRRAGQPCAECRESKAKIKHVPSQRRAI